MRIEATPEWANRSLSACEVGGDPFRVSFDSASQADVTKSQFEHLRKFSGLKITEVGSAKKSLDPELYLRHSARVGEGQAAPETQDDPPAVGAPDAAPAEVAPPTATPRPRAKKGTSPRGRRKTL